MATYGDAVYGVDTYKSQPVDVVRGLLVQQGEDQIVLNRLELLLGLNVARAETPEPMQMAVDSPPEPITVTRVSGTDTIFVTRQDPENPVQVVRSEGTPTVAMNRAYGPEVEVDVGG